MSQIKAKNNDSISLSPVQQMISSCTGAMITSLFVTPLDVVKIRLQAQQKKILQKRSFLYCNGFIENVCCPFHFSGQYGPNFWCKHYHFTGTFDAFVKISKAEGIRSLWSGLPPTLLMAVPATVAYYTIYDQVRDRLTLRAETMYPPLWVPVFAGGFARAVAATLISPLELIRTKMQSQKLSYSEVCMAIRMFVKHDGLFSMWRGLGPTFLRDVPFSAIYWSNYEMLKQYYKQPSPSFWFSFAAGATSGTIAAILTLPFDVIKTHRQIELGEIQALSSQPNSTYSLLKALYQRNGYRALFTGIVPRIVKVAPACAMMISSYEYGKKFFCNYNSSIEKAI